MYVWLSNQIGTSASDITISIVFGITTLLAITAIILFLSRLNKRRHSINRGDKPPRLALCETIAIDRTRHLILVRCDDKEHLLLIGGLSDIVVEANINSTSLVKKKDTQAILTTTETNTNDCSTEEGLFSVDKKEYTLHNSTAPFTKQHVEDSAITAEIEGRQEPSLFIPSQNK